MVHITIAPSAVAAVFLFTIYLQLNWNFLCVESTTTDADSTTGFFSSHVSVQSVNFSTLGPNLTILKEGRATQGQSQNLNEQCPTCTDSATTSPGKEFHSQTVDSESQTISPDHSTLWNESVADSKNAMMTPNLADAVNSDLPTTVTSDPADPSTPNRDTYLSVACQEVTMTSLLDDRSTLSPGLDLDIICSNQTTDTLFHSTTPSAASGFNISKLCRNHSTETLMTTPLTLNATEEQDKGANSQIPIKNGRRPPPPNMIMIVLHFVTGILICVVNSLTLAAIQRSKVLHSNADWYIASLSASGLCEGVFVFIKAFQMLPATRDYINNIKDICHVFRMSGVTTGTASLLSLAGVSMDRCVCISSPLHYRTIQDTLTRILIPSIWIFSILYGCVPFFTDLTKCADMKKNNIPEYRYSLSAMFFAVSILIVCCYIQIFRAYLRGKKSVSRYSGKEIEKKSSAINSFTTSRRTPSASNKAHVTSSLSNGSSDKENDGIQSTKILVRLSKCCCCISYPAKPPSDQGSSQIGWCDISQRSDRISSSDLGQPRDGRSDDMDHTGTEGTSDSGFQASTDDDLSSTAVRTSARGGNEHSCIKGRQTSEASKDNNGRTKGGQRGTSRQSLRLLKTIVVTVAVYIVFFTPARVMLAIVEVYNLPDIAVSSAIYVTNLNAMINFFIYVIFNPRYRRAVKQVVRYPCSFSCCND